MGRGSKFSKEQKEKDNELVDELQELVRPGDLEFNELALQTAFVGTPTSIRIGSKTGRGYYIYRYPFRLVHRR